MHMIYDLASSLKPGIKYVIIVPLPFTLTVPRQVRGYFLLSKMR